MRMTEADYAAYLAKQGRYREVGYGDPPELEHDAPKTPAPDMHETKEFMPLVIELAKKCGWRVYHTHDSRRSEKGFPDLVMVREHRLLFVELKSEKGVVQPEQHEWLLAIRAVAENCRGLDATVPIAAIIWRPEHWHDGTIEGVLR